MSRLLFFADNNRIGSARCRGWDIAEAMGMPFNPPISEVTRDDAVIMIKRVIPEIVEKAKVAYCDIVDGHNGLKELIIANPKIRIIVFTPLAVEIIKREWGIKNEIIWIPHTHCNNENTQRPIDREVKVISYQGHGGGFTKKLWQKFTDLMKGKGFVLKYYGNPVMNGKLPIETRRQACCKCYYETDISVSFRVDCPNTYYRGKLKCSTKLNNSGSFGVPTVAYPEPAFKNNINGNGCFIEADTIAKLVEGCLRLKDDKKLYREMAKQGIEDAVPAHINNVIKHYEELANAV